MADSRRRSKALPPGARQGQKGVGAELAKVSPLEICLGRREREGVVVAGEGAGTRFVARQPALEAELSRRDSDVFRLSLGGGKELAAEEGVDGELTALDRLPGEPVAAREARERSGRGLKWIVGCRLDAVDVAVVLGAALEL